MRILIVEDKMRMAALLQRTVQREGYEALVAHDGEEALEIVENCQLHGIVLDVMLPKLDGFAVLKRMREARVKVPTILLTARDTNHDIVSGLDLGADDYLAKPFDMSVLLARLRALTRRSPVLFESQLRVGNLILRSDLHSIECGGKVIALTPIEFALMETLMQRAGYVIRKEVLAEIGWGSLVDFSEDTLYVFMRALRIKIQFEQPGAVLHTMRGVGYMLKAVTA